MAVTLMLFVKVLTLHTSARVKQASKVTDITAKVTRSFLFHRSYLESKLCRVGSKRSRSDCDAEWHDNRLDQFPVWKLLYLLLCYNFGSSHL